MLMESWSRGSLLNKDCYSDNSSLQGRRPVQHHINVLYMCLFDALGLSNEGEMPGLNANKQQKEAKECFWAVGSVVHTSRPHLHLLHGDAALRPKDWPLDAFHWNAAVNADEAGAGVFSFTADFSWRHSTFPLSDEETCVSELVFITLLGAHALTVVINEQIL